METVLPVAVATIHYPSELPRKSVFRRVARDVRLSFFDGCWVHNLRRNNFSRSTMMSTIKDKIQNAGKAAKDATKQAGQKIKEGADAAADKTADAAKATGEAMKNAGHKLKEKSGK
jgi:hypothetical protein